MECILIYATLKAVLNER